MKPPSIAPGGPRATAFLAIGLGVGCLFFVGKVFASTDLVSINRAFFPDRSWVPSTAADGGAVGAGQAVEGLSSWIVNPANLEAIADSNRIWLRLSGFALDPSRGDIAGTTLQYSDESPFLTFGENVLAVVHNQWLFAAGLDQVAFQEEKQSFIDTSSFAGQPVRIVNTTKSSLTRAAFTVGRRLDKVTVAASVEVYRSREKLTSQRAEDSQMIGPSLGLPAAVDLSGYTAGGAAGVHIRPKPWLMAGAVGRAAGSFDLEDQGSQEKVGQDEVPPSFDLGFRVGKGSGGNLLLDAQYMGERRASLGDSVGRGAETSSARWTLAGAYAYRHPQQVWDFRLGLGWSPRPADDQAMLKRFGVALGFDLEGIVIRGSFSLESRSSGDGRDSDRRLFGLTADVRL